MTQGYCVITNKFCYIPILKCASVSMLNAMLQIPEVRDDNFLSNPEVLNLCVVTLLRDPVDRFISAFNYRQQNKEPELRGKETPLHVLETLEKLEDMHFKKQFWFLAGAKPNIVGRVEKMDVFERELSIKIPVMNIQQNDWFEKHSNKDLLCAIKTYYSEDYLLLEKYS